MTNVNVLTSFEALQETLGFIDASKNGDDPREINDDILKAVYDFFPIRIENYGRLRERTLRVKDYLRSLPNSNGKIAIVSHSSFLKGMTC